jgi:hypothetical protein
MSNTFKVNSRFSSLMEETQEKSESNNRKGNKNDNAYGERMNNRFKTTVNDRKSTFGGDKKKQSILLNDINFPTLTPDNATMSNNVKIQPINTNFIEKLTAIIKEDDKEKNIEDNILPGWLVMTRDKDTNKIITQYGEPTIFERKKSPYYEIIAKLVCLHDKRTEDYKNTWGQEEYEKMFLFPNYDYDYFERLDEEYEEELEQLREYESLKYVSEEDYYDD